MAMLSLRVQGEPTLILDASAILRAIPARAGRTYDPHGDALGVGGHPCACRENSWK